MVSPLFYYQLALCVLVWLFVMLHVTWSKPGLPTPPGPAKPKRHRANASQTVEGLTTKPHGALCEREPVPPNPPAPRPPDPVPLTHRRPPTVDTSMHLGPPPRVPLAAGSGWASCAPMVIPPAAPGVRATGPPARAIAPSILARSAMANRPRWSGACGSGPAWPKVWVSAPPRGAARLVPTRGCSGGAQRPRSGAPLPRLACVLSTWSSCNSLHGTRCGATATPARAATRKPSSVGSAPHPGCGRRWPLGANCWSWSMSAAAPARWPSAWGLR
jgi:hypothetical protein